MESRRRIVVNGVEFCSIEHLRAFCRPQDNEGEEGAQASAVSSSQRAPEQGGAVPPPPRRPDRMPKLEYLIHNCCEAESIDDSRMLVLVGERVLGGAIFCTFGCHPHNYNDYDDAMEGKLLQALRQCGRKSVAWGECGLDYYKNFYKVDIPGEKSKMIDAFARQARLAASLGLPLVVHSRDAEEDTMEVLREALPREHHVHIHAFQGSVRMMQDVLEVFPNSVIGLSGAITFKRQDPNVVKLAKTCPLDRLVLETDAPFLSEEPSHVPRIAQAVARVRGIRAAEVLVAANRNCRRFYKLPEPSTA